MRFTPFALAAAAASGALAAPQREVRPAGRGFGCGAPEPDAEHIKISQQFAAQEAQARVAASGNFTIQAVTTVDTYFHVVAASTSVSGGYITDTMLNNQLAALNEAYAPHSIQFTLKGTTRTVNANWANDDNGYEMTMKRSLRKGTYRTLNVYFLNGMGDNLGYCYFPEAGGATAGSTTQIRDGCTVLAASVPGGSATNFNLGGTTIHEVGHWFGLYHTFQGGCTGSGDSVSDTPAQASASSGCPVGRDSCPNAAGVDPIHNYMDYSYDTCYEEFTSGQQSRMLSFFNNYRAGK
ncbi:metalloprotease [Parachaetomium inaequale]|uniref:Metalloprotease n=1 Tax=Parachaetomium inaequale TaxID=2588326 RepID=A0AAN6P9M9_9PEZI|nr:metalloprotease [Parachaetomium inaequale]